jgi:hypothetical protein
VQTQARIRHRASSTIKPGTRLRRAWSACAPPSLLVMACPEYLVQQ